MKEQPFWTEQIKDYRFPTLEGNAKADVTIIGAGLAGILSAYLLSKTGKKIILLEAGEILKNGYTSYTTAFITQVIDTSASELVEIYGKTTAQEVLQSGRDAIDLIERIVKEEKIECGFMRCPIYIYAADKSQIAELSKEKDAYDRINFQTEYREHNNLDFNNHGYLKIEGQAKFNPIQFVAGVLGAAVRNGVEVFQKTKATEVSGERPYTVKTEHGEIATDQVIISTYQPFNNPKEVLLKKGMYISYVFEATVQSHDLEEALYIDLDNPYHYFRVDKYQDRTGIILGGEDHKSWFKIDSKKSYNALEEYARKILGNDYVINYRWAGGILEPSDGLALIGRIRPGYYLASAFSGNGMTYSAISAMVFNDLVQGRENAYAKLYDPTRFNPKRWVSKFGDYFEELVGGAAKNVFKEDEDRQKGSGRHTAGPQAA